MITYTKIQRIRMFRQHGSVEVFVWGLVSVVLGYSIFIPWSWTLPKSQQWLFWQIHTLVFVGCAVVHAITLIQTPAPQSKLYRTASVKLLILSLLTSILSLLDIDAYGSVLNLLLYVYIYGGHVFGLSYVIPLRSLPRARLIRLIAFSTLLSIVIVDIALRSVLPRLITNWVWTPAAIAMEVRMAMTVSLSFLYINIYRYFGLFRGRVVLAAGLGILAMLCMDIMFTAGTFLIIRGGSDKIYSLAIPFWDLHQLLWALALYWGAKGNLQWRSIDDRRQLPGRLGQWVIVRQGVLLGVLILISSNVIPSLLSLILLVGALLVYQAMMMLEREQLIQKQHATQKQLLEANRQLEVYAQQVDELATERVRLEVSRDLHDSVKHILVNVRWQAMVGQEISETDPEAVPAILGEVRQQAERGLDEVHHVVRKLRALESTTPLMERVEELAAGFPIATVLPVAIGDERVLSAEKREHLFAIVKEALTNVGKYAEATRVDVHIDYRDPACVKLVIQDDGCGVHELKPGVGLENIRWRANDLGGRARFYPNPGSGFRVEVEVPA